MKTSGLAALLLGLSVSTHAQAAAFDLLFDTPRESKALSVALTPGSTVSLAGLLTPGSVTESLTFNWATASDFSLSAAWRVGALAATTPRLVGVNVDLFDSANSLVGSDTFGGLAAEIASSSLQIATLAAGTYRLVLTGTAVRDGIFDVDFTAGSVLPPTPSPPIATPDPTRFGYDTLAGEKKIAAPFAMGDTLGISGDSGELGALFNETELTITSTTLSAGIRWLVGSAAGSDPRLVGVNVDLFNALDMLVASDIFGGVSGGQATSSLLATGITPGTYRLRMTGNSVRGARYEIALSTDATPPVVPPIGNPVPEPASWALMLLGFAAIGARLRRREAAVPFMATSINAWRRDRHSHHPTLNFRGEPGAG